MIARSYPTHSNHVIATVVRKGTTACGSSGFSSASSHRDTFYFCHFHSTACSKRCAFLCHITVFLTTSRQQHPLYRTPFSFPLAPFRLLLPRSLPHLPNKVPTRNKASLFKGATASKVSRPFLFPLPLFFSFPTRLCLRSSACWALLPALPLP